MRSLILLVALLATPAAVVAQAPGVERPPHAARFIVTVEVQRRPVALGVVLAHAGRVLTTLEPLREAPTIQLVYPDGRRDDARVVATDDAWGVALLEGNAGAWPHGVELALRDARSRDAVRWFAATDAAASEGRLVRRRSFVGFGATLLRDAWELDPVPAASAIGGPLLHAQEGSVVGLVAPPASNDITGAETAFGVPLSVLRAVVDRAGESTRPWIGVTFAEVLGGQGDVASPGGGLRVREVDPEGPGARAGLRGGPRGDLVVAVDGRAVRTIAGFGELISTLRAGDTITLQVLRRGAISDVPLRLAERPQPRPRTRAPATGARGGASTAAPRPRVAR